MVALRLGLMRNPRSHAKMTNHIKSNIKFVAPEILRIQQAFGACCAVEVIGDGIRC